MTHYWPPVSNRLFAAVDATWPPHRIWQQDGWTVREGRGGGKRVSAVSQAAAQPFPDVDQAAGIMTRMGQPCLFMLRPEDSALDRLLGAAGYGVLDPVAVLAAPLSDLPTDPPTQVPVFAPHPTPEMAGVWQAGGVDAARQDVMRRCWLPKTCILLRAGARPAAVAFAACHEGLVMCHAVEVLAAHRRQGLGRDIMRAAFGWARAQRAHTIAVLVTRENGAALALYRGLGLTEVAGYHYRIKPG